MNNSFRTSRKPSPKVVSIPVHFVNSGFDEPLKPAVNVITRATAALKIQKIGRGFLVRKSMKKIAAIRNEVDEIDRRISKVEVIELMINYPKERIRINESLMALLFKLDSVRGVDSGVRAVRKAVTKKVIALQERVDAIVAAGAYQNLGAAALDIEDSIESESVLDQTVDSEATADNMDQMVDIANCESDIASEQIKEAVVVETEQCHDEIEPNLVEIAASQCEPQFHEESEGDRVEENCLVREIDQSCDSVKDVSECFEESFQTCYTDDYEAEIYPKPPSLIDEGDGISGEVGTEWINAENYLKPQRSLIDEGEGISGEVGAEWIKIEVEERDDKKSNRELLEKMMEENVKMMNMMKQIFERNEQQSQMLNTLSHRVEQLEKAFVSDIIRRKKKRQQ